MAPMTKPKCPKGCKKGHTDRPNSGGMRICNNCGYTWHPCPDYEGMKLKSLPGSELI